MNATSAAFSRASLVLTVTQAEAVYAAMCSLNNISARFHALDLQMPGRPIIQVHEAEDGSIVISTLHQRLEMYANQAAFALAYRLRHG